MSESLKLTTLGFLLDTKIAGIIGHRMHVFAAPGHFYASYSDGGTLGYQVPLRRPAPKVKKEPRFRLFGLSWSSGRKADPVPQCRPSLRS